MKRFFYNKLKNASSVARKERSGMTLIEILVAMIISFIIMGVLLSVFLVVNSTYLSSTKRATAQNLAVQTMQKIKDTVRYKSVSVTHITTGDGIYYSSTDDGIRMGSSTYLKGTYKGYKCTFTFADANSTNNLLSIEITITDSKGNQLIDTTGSVYLLNGTISTGSGTDSLTVS